jgi:hypothetical protein
VDPNTADPSRRDLIAALAGGLALATPAAAGKKGNKKPKPPLAAAVAQFDAVAASGGTVDSGILFGYRIAVLEFASGDVVNIDAQKAFVEGGSADAMRADLVRSVAQTAAALLADAVPADRIAVLLI